MVKHRVRTALLAAVCAGGLAVAPPTSADASHRTQYTAKEVGRFLDHFYGRTGPSDWARDNLVAEDLKERAAQQPPGFDLLICHRNAPEDIDHGPVTTAQSAGVGWATVFLSWGDDQEIAAFTAYVDLDKSRPLKLLDVNCEPPETDI